MTLVADGARPDSPADAPPGPITRRWLALRDRLLMDGGFQRWAAAFPLTRFMARRRQRELFDLVAGFVYTQTLYSAQQLGVFERLAAALKRQRSFLPCWACHWSRWSAFWRRQCRCDLSTGAQWPVRPWRSWRGLARQSGRHGDDRASCGALSRSGRSAAPAARSCRPTELSAYWSYARNESAGALAGNEVAEYSRLMAVSQQFIAAEILAAHPLARHQRLLDIGGGRRRFHPRCRESHAWPRFHPVRSSRRGGAGRIGLSRRRHRHTREREPAAICSGMPCRRVRTSPA